MYQVIEKLREIGQLEGTTMEALALRWLLHHSALEQGDGIIIGASKLQQVQATVDILNAGPLSRDAAAKLSELWALCRDDAQSIVSY
jgi:aflatoxin B1 aldehyde reductase